MVEVRFTGFATLHWLEEIFRDRVGDPLFYWLDRQSRLPMIDDKVFEETDNLMVFFFDDQEHRIKMRAITNMLLKTLQRHDELKDVKPFYAYRTKKPKKETNSTTADSPASDSTPSAAAAAAASDAIPLGASVDDELPPMNVMMYKGQRRASLKVPFPPSGLTELPVPLEELLTFFKPRSQAADEVAHTAECPVRTITHDTFEVAVVAQATPTNPVLVQLYEDTCFLCFLMRPFVNSVAKILADNNVPLTIVRLNIERNDFPKDCPVARGTPTFVLFKEWKKPERWAEFKPKDFISRLEAAIGPDALTDTMRLQFTHLLDMLPVRLTLFSNLAFQLVDLNGLQAVSMGPQGEGGVGESSVKNMPPIAALQHTPPSAAAAPPAGRSDTGEGSKANGGSSEEFQRVVTELMEADMNRVDCLAENVELLKREADQAESDVLYYAILMAEKLVEWERKARSE
ncbi:unnamed protein product [Vitrella brassicaformis CCMP3155]|uniref:Thioredoxin domain-containing protein n=1 Tax=Vitrella brassicaformis (strain CCMP3155) TaxID=1169540 RepID=A0A0G4FWU1_VITBC|nr:unnamed protein product [Vitrella brassicaformis CCMP3155]|eukprot:CEM19411.1 unnamed protein product [Vitrella brassicaformis CCMP3155]